MEEKLTFVSVVGTQALGTFGPLMAIVSKKGPMPIKLLHTNRTRSVSERLAEYIKAYNCGEAELIPITIALDTERSGPELVKRIAENAREAGGRVCLNLDGGFNFLISAIILELEQYLPLYIQAARDRAVLTDSADETHHAIKLMDSLSPEEILDLQGVAYEADVKDNPEAHPTQPLASIVAGERINLPGNVLNNVKIGDRIFEYVWTPGNNRLSFVKDLRKPLANRGAYKDRDRDFIQWSKDRNRCGQLYDKRIYAIVKDAKSEQRLNEDSSGQIQAIFYDPPAREKINPRSNAGDALAKIFAEKPPKVAEKQLNVPKPSPATALRDETLVVCVGKDLFTTILAIESHRPRHVLLAYSRAEPLIGQYVERLCAAGKEFGLESIEAVDFKLEGIYADKVLPEAASGSPRVVVNITPGTKGQGAMLTRWAARHGYEVWSINGRAKQCSPLLAPEGAGPVPLRACDPALLFRLLGRKLLDEGKSGRDLACDFGWLDALLEFMRRLDAAGLDFHEALQKGGIEPGRDRLKHLGAKNWRLTLDGREHFFTKESDGVWFEKLCGRALMNAGATHVRLNLKLDWDEENKESIRNKYGDSAPFLLELDVIGAVQNHLVMISAKSYDLREEETRPNCDPLADVILEARNTSNIMDKFTLSLVTHMGTTKKTSDDRVAVLTWRDICHPDKLAQEIRDLAARQSTTEQES